MRQALRKKQASETAHRRQIIARLYLQGVSQYAIADQLKISQPAVSQHLSAIRDEWRKSALVDYNERKAAEVAQLDEVQRNAWEAWAKSRTDANGQATGEGNPQFLNVIVKCIQERKDIFGLAAPLQVMAGGVLPWLEPEPTDVEATVSEPKRIDS